MWKSPGPRLLLSVCLALGCVAAHARAEQLPVRTYTTTDGLARDYVGKIVQDSHGFIWFCTSEGLSRFDGYRFTNYGTAQGLPSRLVYDLLETRGGVYWVSTGGGLVLFDPDALTHRNDDGTSTPGRLFTVVPFPSGASAKTANVAYEDASGVVWCGSDVGLYRVVGGPGASSSWKTSRMPRRRWRCCCATGATRCRWSTTVRPPWPPRGPTGRR